MNNLYDINTVKSILSRHGFKFSHSLGQNFIIDPDICPQMAELCGARKGVCAVEIGPGIGVLTRELAKRAEKVVSIELDERLIPVLSETMADFNNVKIINADALKTDFNKLISENFGNCETVICANLPYYITSEMIMYILEEKIPVKSLTVMVQKETAVRLCSPPGERECGAVSIAVNYYAEPEILFEVSRDSFIPSPNVDSAVIKLSIREKPPVEVCDEALFFETVKNAFLKRRKTVLNSLSAGFQISRGLTAQILADANIPENCRAEQLSLRNFADIANAYAKFSK